MAVDCYAARSQGQALTAHRYDPSPLGAHEIEVEITHCGLCHSDIHLIDNDWGISSYPLIPGHEVIGMVRDAGPQVTGVKSGQRVGIGWQCGSCLECRWCRSGQETCCPKAQPTCIGRPGGFAKSIRIDGRFAYSIPEALDSAEAAPLLCAGITVYTPLSRYARPQSRVGVIGIGGLGHLALRFAHAFGCEVTAFSTSPDKGDEAVSLGADHFVVSNDAKAMAAAAGSLDVLLSTVTAGLDWDAWMQVLAPRGTLCLVGAAPGPMNVTSGTLITGAKSIAGSNIGDRVVMQEMLEFAARQRISASVETMPMGQVNAAIEKVKRNQARYRVVLANT